MMDAFDYFFMIVILGVFAVISCGVTNDHLDRIHKDIKELKAPVKSPEQIKLEDLEKQLEELTEKTKKLSYDKATCSP